MLIDQHLALYSKAVTQNNRSSAFGWFLFQSFSWRQYLSHNKSLLKAFELGFVRLQRWVIIAMTEQTLPIEKWLDLHP